MNLFGGLMQSNGISDGNACAGKALRKKERNSQQYGSSDNAPDETLSSAAWLAELAVIA